VPNLQLAPLHGVTNRHFRAAYFRHFGGFDSAVAPFVLAVPGAELKKNFFKDLVPPDGTGIPLVPQILGNDPGSFIAAGRILAEAGYPCVNWNLGCPYSMVAKKKRGSGLLPFPDRIGKFLETVCGSLEIPVSVKLRLGMRDPSELVALMPVLNRYPLESVIIHARIGIQMYSGAVDLDGFARAAELCRHRVAYNGDITDVGAFRSLSGRFPRVNDWMIGRWALQDPFLASDIKADRAGASGPARGSLPAGRIATLRAFHEDLYAAYRSVLCGPGHVLAKMGEVWPLLGHSFPENAKELAGIARAHTFADYEHAVRGILG